MKFNEEQSQIMYETLCDFLDAHGVLVISAKSLKPEELIYQCYEVIDMIHGERQYEINNRKIE